MKNQNASMKFIFCTILLESLGLGIVIPVLPDIIRRFSSDPQFINVHFGYFIAIYACMQFLMAPILGSLSDRYGRRPILLISIIGAAVDYVFMAFAATLPLLYIGRVISGFTGAGVTVASSYIADVSNDTNRSANFGLLGAAFGLGFIVGPMLGGILGEWSLFAPFLGAAALNLLNFLFGWFVLPESLPPEKRRAFTALRLNPFASLKKILKPSDIFLYVWVYFFIYLAGQAHPSIWTLYTEYKFNWTPFQVGLSLSFTGLAIAFSQGYLTRILIPKWGESRAVILGLIAETIGFMLFAFATHGWMMYAIMGIYAFAGVAGPALQSLISRQTPSSEQGELQGSLISIASITSILGPLLYTGTFGEFTGPNAPVQFAGISYFIAGIICLAAVALFASRSRSLTPKQV